MITRLITALKDEFGGSVTLHEQVPSTLTAPSVVIAPGEPFLLPGNHGTVTESWDILVVFNPTGPDRGVTQMRNHSLRVRRAASSVGAAWSQTHAPRKATPDNDTTALAVSEVSFRYNPDGVLDPESE